MYDNEPYILESPKAKSYDRGLSSFSENGPEWADRIPFAPPQEISAFAKLKRHDYIIGLQCPWCGEHDSCYIIDYDALKKHVHISYGCGMWNCRTEFARQHRYYHKSQIRYILNAVKLNRKIKLKPEQSIQDIFKPFSFADGILKFLKKRRGQWVYISDVRNSLNRRIAKEGTYGEEMFIMALDQILFDKKAILDNKKLQYNESEV